MRRLAEHGIAPIDMVVVNLYRFEEVAARAGAPLEELIENIDIGGPTMIRAAAKNYQDVAVVVSPDDYAAILEELRAGGGDLSLETQWRLAKKAFRTTADYDSAISARLEQVDHPGDLPLDLALRAPKLMDLRYGENPHQSPRSTARAGAGIAGARQLHGKELSYNNLVDLDAAWQLACEFDRPAAAIIKHTNPVRLRRAGDARRGLPQSLRRRSGLGLRRRDRPQPAGGRRDRARDRQDFRRSHRRAGLLAGSAGRAATPRRTCACMRVAPGADRLVVKSISGGYLAQTADDAKLDRATAVVKTKRAPTEEEWAALEFGWKVAKHVKSNAIVYARAGQMVGVGAGQMSRVDSVKLGAMKAVLPLAGTVVASDAFFPFPDGVEEAVEARRDRVHPARRLGPR